MSCDEIFDLTDGVYFDILEYTSHYVCRYPNGPYLLTLTWGDLSGVWFFLRYFPAARFVVHVEVDMSERLMREVHEASGWRCRFVRYEIVARLFHDRVQPVATPSPTGRLPAAAAAAAIQLRKVAEAEAAAAAAEAAATEAAAAAAAAAAGGVQSTSTLLAAGVDAPAIEVRVGMGLGL